MTRPDRDPSGSTSRSTWLAAGAALLGAATMLVRRTHHAKLRAAVGARYDEESGRGRAGTPPSTDSRSAGHETDDLAGGTLGKLLLMLGSAAVLMVVAMIGFRLWVTQAQRSAEPPYTAVQTATIVPPKPNLQAAPLEEIAALHEREDHLLQGFAFLDDARTRARIPLDRALALTVGQPLAPPP